MSASASDVEVDPSDFERPRRVGVRGVIESAHAVLHLCIYPHAGTWTAEAVVELANDAGSLQTAMRFTAPTARDAWAALNADLTRQFGRCFQ